MRFEFSRQIFQKIFKYKISRNSVQWGDSSFAMRADGKTSTTKLTVVSRNFANATKNKRQRSTSTDISVFKFHLILISGARCWWRSWLRHCATSRKVEVSIPDGVIEIFHEHNPSGRSMLLGSTQPLT